MSQNLEDIDPKKLKIVISPHKALTIKSQPVETLSDNIFKNPEQVKAIAERMINILRSMPNGIGLAANQVGVNFNIFVSMSNLNDRRSGDKPIQVYVNPKKISIYGGILNEMESCLSFPKIAGRVKRPDIVCISFQDIYANNHYAVAGSLQGRCWQHEIDHLLGINIPDHFDKHDLHENSVMLKKLKWKPRKLADY